MPCYTVQLTTVQFQAQHVELLRAALNTLQLKFDERNNPKRIRVLGSFLTIDLDAQEIRYDAGRTETSLVNRIKQEYSRQAIQLAATKNKWIVKQLADRKLALRRF